MRETVHARFTAQVRETPDAIALIWSEQTLSYAELEQRSNQLARSLAAEVRPGDRVGLLCQRSPDTITAILATLKLGATFVPFDLGYPPAQLALMLEDAQPALILSDAAGESLASELGGSTPRRGVEALIHAAAGESDASLPDRATSDDLAYVMFTSGSHGRPKGVMVRHRGIHRLVRDQCYASFARDEVVLHMAPLAFDASTFELWGPLLNGGAVAILSTPRPSLAEIGQIIRDAGVTTAWMTAGLFHAMVDERVSDLAPLRQLLAGGDVLSPEHVRRAHAALPGCRIINGYGPTENTTFTCCYTIPRSSDGDGAIPIGEAIHGTTVYVVDSELRPVPDGAEGQLVTGGDGVAAGYLGRSDLTAERFVADPFSNEPGATLYLTGDMVRRRPDGQLEFLGRRDRQLKIDGKRVELDEIEAVLRRAPEVSDAAVIAREDSPGQKRLVAYVVFRDRCVGASAEPRLAKCREALIDAFARHMVPSHYLALAALPLNAQGKVDRKSLPAPVQRRTVTASGSSSFERELAQLWADVLGTPAIEPDVNIFDLGGTSLHVVRIHERLSARYPQLELLTMFEQPSVRALARHLEGVAADPPARRIQGRHELAHDAIAIVGVAGRFPGAASVEEFWRNLCEGVESITHFEDHELEDAFSEKQRQSEDYVRARAILRGIDQFDAKFFGVSLRDAALTDPQYRLFLECAWEALEDAGCDASAYRGSIGVFAGCSPSSYLLRNVLVDRRAVERFTSEYQVGMYSELLGGLSDTLATRVAYKLNLKGPAATVQTACSTSLFAVAQACQSLWSSQCDMALAGGVSITLPQRRGYMYQEGGMVSRDGHCRPFDAAASGTVFGSGAGAVLLKRLGDALADGDAIYAVVRGVGVNNDGSDKAGFTAPSAEGQARAIITAQTLAGVEPASIGYVETHGTATPLGDPIEFAGLRAAFSRASGLRNHCALGSVKANVGHLDAAAGVVSLIKAALCVKHATIPPILHFQRANPRIDLEHSPFYVPDACRAWPASSSAPRRAGVSSFGVGGTNVHLVIEQAPARAPRPSRDVAALRVLPLSAKGSKALASQCEALAAHLESHPDVSLDHVAHTLQYGRRTFDCRTAVSARSTAEAITQLRAASEQRAQSPSPDTVVFMFPGQGAQFAGMGRGLYETVPAFREEIDAGAELLRPILDADIRQLLLCGADTPLTDTAVAQPALFVLMHALCEQWRRLGVRPDVVVGHSVGEFVAATVSGALGYEDALRFVALRARLMRDLPEGAMLAVRLSEEDARAKVTHLALDLAAVNGPSACVVAGPFEAIEALEASLRAEDVPHRRLQTSHAFHSAMMDDAVDALARAAAELPLFAPRMGWVSSVHGAEMTERALREPGYFATHCRSTVRFADALRVAAGGKRALLIEVGPGRALCAFAHQVLAVDDCIAAIPSLREPDHDALDDMFEAAGKVFASGVPVTWSALPDAGHQISLPTYPFERVRCWVDAPTSKSGAIIVPLEQPNSEPRVTSATTPSSGRLQRLTTEVAAILQSISGNELAVADRETNFLELGFDSLALGQVAVQVQKQFKLKIGFRQLMSDHCSCAKLAAHLDATLPAELATQASAPSIATTETSGPLADIFQAQLRAMQELIAQQNKLLAAAHGRAALPASPLPGPVAETPSRYRQFDPKSAAGPRRAITAGQQAFIEDLSRRYVAKTPASRASTQENRARLADPRAASGFRREWKELCYPIVSSRSKGSKLWDLDGNAYVDLVNGYGQTMFGHAPDFVQAAVAEQLATGFAIGPQSPLAGEVASMICDFVGMERATFCNTGSEAVMAAMRVARCATGRDKIAVFANDYHGQFDEVLVRGRASGGEPSALPLAPGIPQGSVANMIVLPYGSEESLAYLRAHMEELAAVIVEPVQSRHPELRPYEFLQQLRAATAAADTALVFDEVVTGFRVHPGGMQAVTGIRADLATYGKVVGGGMPVGVLAGSARFMDTLDGGTWRYGDDSFPEVAPTFFAGTFVRHPLVLAACKAVLEHLRAAGPKLQEELAQRTAALVTRINADLERKGVPSRLETFSSWFMPNFSHADPLGALFYAHARLLGLHVQDGFPCFLTTAHDAEDFECIERVFAQSVDALQSAGCLLPETSAVVVPIAPAREVAVAELPLTEPQTEILLSAQLGDAASASFNESVSVALRGELDVPSLQASLDDIVARHEALRGSIVQGQARLRITPRLTLELPLLDVSGAPDPQRALDEFIAGDARAAFDLTAGPLVRARLLALDGLTHVLVLTAHHIVCDGWSINVIASEVAELYRARRHRETPRLDTLKSFSEYAREQVASQDLRAQEYWLSQYQTLPVPLELPADRPWPAERSFAGATYTHFIEAALLRDLRKAGAKQGCTLFTTLLGGMQILISRLCGQNDVVIACPFAGQSSLEDEVLVGHCVHFLPLRCPLQPASSASDHLKRLNRTVLDALEHQQYTFGTLVRQLKPVRESGRLPITSLQFNLERIADGVGFEGLETTVTPNPKAFSNFDMFWNVAESERGLRIDCDYNCDILDRATVARWLDAYAALLAELVRDMSRPVARMPVLSAHERELLTHTLNQTDREYPRASRASDLFEARAAETPQAIAVLDAEGEITYAELDREVNQLARVIERRVPAEGRVAIAVDRSHRLPLALLAVMKAGRTYVPLDIELPPARVEQLLALADVSALLCDSDVTAALGPRQLPQIRMDAAELAREEAEPLGPKFTAAHAPAYMIFTSGSTGTPKGVEVGHAALTNCLTSVAAYPGFGSSDLFVAVSTVSFDIAAVELLLPLTTGGRVYVASRDEVRAGFPLVQRVDRLGATHLQATPTLWRMLLEAGFRGRPGLNMWSTGEPLSRDLADALLQAGGPLYNLYGPTETTIWASLERVKPSPSPISIGQPLANTQLYVLDPERQLCPLGSTGELYIGGDCLANGYFRRPDLTAQTFVEVALEPDRPLRLYRTGDLARRLADGSLQVPGRRDHQIKLHGYRIELEEVEHALRQVAAIRAAAVARKPGPDGAPRLVGYVVPQAGASVNLEQLASALLAKLPNYMVPSAWMTLDALPQTDNGKLNRNALPDPKTSASAAPRKVAGPRTSTEADIHRIWADVLRIDTFGVDERLFSLGADSLHVFRMVARMNERGIRLTARDLMRNPTVSQLATEWGARTNAAPARPSLPSLDSYRRSTDRGAGRP